MSSSEFVSLCRDFTSLFDYVNIGVKEVKCTFLVTGKASSGKYSLKIIMMKELKKVTIANKKITLVN